MDLHFMYASEHLNTNQPLSDFLCLLSMIGQHKNLKLVFMILIIMYQPYYSVISNDYIKT